jgi:hypothetical protein
MTVVAGFQVSQTMTAIRQAADYPVLQRLMINLVQSRVGRPISPQDAWLNDAQALARKMFEHLTSLWALANPQCLVTEEGPAFSFVDHGSVKVVARAALETYLVFYFLCGGSDRACCEFRHWIWKYGGLADRQKFPATNAETRKVQADDKAEMDRLLPLIEQSPYLKNYGDPARKKILKGEWRGTDSWLTLAKEAGFHERYFRQIYGYLCAYSHASYLSALQIGQAKSLDDQQDLASFCLGIGVVLMAHFARTYTQLFADTQPILDVDPEAKAAVTRWYFDVATWDTVIAKQSGAVT